MKNVLILEKRGCDFFEDDEELKKYSDVGNYRVYSHCVGINGVSYHLEFQRGFKNEITKGGKIKHIHDHKLFIDTQYDTERMSYRDLKIEKELNNADFTYCLSDIKKVVNKIADNKIDDILIFNNIYNEINSLGGYREKNILSNCILTQLIQDDNNYEVIRFIDNNENYFDYEAKSKRIVG